jgi:hypothetical protein
MVTSTSGVWRLKAGQTIRDQLGIRHNLFLNDAPVGEHSHLNNKIAAL